MNRHFTIVLGLIVIGMINVSFGWTMDSKDESTRSKMVLVKFDHWKTKFFGLPVELPIILAEKETFDPKQGRYDFVQGIKAMDIYCRMKPKSRLTKSYRKFMNKWPLYQRFFKAVDQENYDLAKSILEKIIVVDSEDPAVYFYKGSLSTHLKKYQEAEKYYKKCLTYYSDYGPAYIHLARLAKARGDSKAAKTYLEEVVKRVGPNEQEGAGMIARKMLDTIK